MVPSNHSVRAATTRLFWTASTMRRALRRPPRQVATPWPEEAVDAREAFRRQLRVLVAEGMDCAPPLELHVVSFSSEHDVPEQVVSTLLWRS